MRHRAVTTTLTITISSAPIATDDYRSPRRDDACRVLRQTAQAGLGFPWSRPASDILVADHWKSVDIETDFQAVISACKADILASTASTASGPSSRCVGGGGLSTRGGV